MWHHPKYVTSGTCTPTPTARATRGTPQKVAFGVVTPSQFDEDRTLTSTPSCSASSSEGLSGSEAATCSNSAHFLGLNDSAASGFKSRGATHSKVPARQASSDEAYSSESTPEPQEDVPTPVPEDRNRWCVSGLQGRKGSE